MRSLDNPIKRLSIQSLEKEEFKIFNRTNTLFFAQMRRITKENRNKKLTFHCCDNNRMYVFVK
jgi:hypothetical protein